MSTEFELIDHIQRRITQVDDQVVIGIGDDACQIRPTPQRDCVVTTDVLVLDRHFRSDWSAADIGFLAMTANLSDLAAMAATPRWALLTLTLPKKTPWATTQWLDGFLDGFLEAGIGVSLVGGNLSEGPVNIGVQLMGDVDPKQIVTRRGSQVGDQLLVTGTVGDAAGAVWSEQQNRSIPPKLSDRWHRPSARVVAAQAIAGDVRAMIDISDGLLADLDHLLAECQLGAVIDVAALPTSRDLLQAVTDDQTRWALQLGGGSDYELLMSVEPNRVNAVMTKLSAMGVPVQRIGAITSSAQVKLEGPSGQTIAKPAAGWDHFSS